MTEFPTINRYAVTLLPTEACLDWVRSCPDNDPPYDSGGDAAGANGLPDSGSHESSAEDIRSATSRPCSRKN